MNPLDLSGPSFLLFYAALATVLIGLAASTRLYFEGGDAPKMNLDPYLIAYLRGGIREVLRVATIGLIDRKLLHVERDVIARDFNTQLTSVQEPVERWILTKTRVPISGSDLVATVPDRSIIDSFEKELQLNGLLPDSDMTGVRGAVFFSVLAVLLATSGLKVLLAVSRGKGNVWFLVCMTLAASYVLSEVCFPRVSAKGRAMLEDLQTLYSRLRDRAQSIRSGGGDSDAVMLAAVFGIDLLPASQFAYASQLFPRETSVGVTSGGSSCGGSCGSSCGGGCGGGCGGCGA